MDRSARGPALTLSRFLRLAWFGLLALVLIAAFAFRNPILRASLDPKQPFQTYQPPPAPDYASRSAWALFPSGPDQGGADVFFVPLGESARVRCVQLATALRAAGVRTDLAYGNRGLKGAMKGADRSGARYAVVLGDRDLESAVAQVKDLTPGEQHAIALDRLVEELTLRTAQYSSEQATGTKEMSQ